MKALVSPADVEAALRSRDGVEAQRLMNLLTGADSAEVQVVHAPPVSQESAEQRARYAAAVRAAYRNMRPGVLDPRAMLDIIAEMSATIHAGDVGLNIGFLEGLAGIILHTPFNDLAALRAEIAPLLEESAVA